MAFSDAERTDIRRFCGYPAYGASPEGNMGWRFFQAYGALEYRMTNLSLSEEAVVRAQMSVLVVLEVAVPAASDHLDTDIAAVWTRNRSEIVERYALLDEQRRRLCAFFGVPPGPGLGNAGIALVV